MAELKVGQVRKNRRNKPDSVYVVTEVTPYADEGKFDAKGACFVVGVLCTDDNHVQPARRMHENSCRKMFPYVMFEPNTHEDNENK